MLHPHIERSNPFAGFIFSNYDQHETSKCGESSHQNNLKTSINSLKYEIILTLDSDTLSVNIEHFDTIFFRKCAQ